MKDFIFRKAILISIIGHITMFSIFSFSFGYRIPAINYPDISFQGAILQSFDLISRHTFHIRDIKDAFIRKPDIRALDKKDITYPLTSDYYSKPQTTLAFNEDKMIFVAKETPQPFAPKRKEPPLMFYPPLPYHFMLYFKDRRFVHIEIMFNISSTDGKNSIIIKRKISSGNLEVDLLSMRYLSHYLFIQQKRFVPNSWQTVKIDFSPKE